MQYTIIGAYNIIFKQYTVTLEYMTLDCMDIFMLRFYIMLQRNWWYYSNIQTVIIVSNTFHILYLCL